MENLKTPALKKRIISNRKYCDTTHMLFVIAIVILVFIFDHFKFYFLLKHKSFVVSIKNYEKIGNGYEKESLSKTKKNDENFFIDIFVRLYSSNIFIKH